MGEPRDSVIDPSLPKPEQEKRVEDEIEKSDADLFGEKSGRKDERGAPDGRRDD